MSSYGSPDPKQRVTDAMAARKAMLEKFRAASTDPRLVEKLAERAKINEAREARLAEREAARKAHEAELAAKAAREAELAAQAAAAAAAEAERLKAEEFEIHEQLLAEQKAARDARYAARKAANKKKRKRGL